MDASPGWFTARSASRLLSAACASLAALALASPAAALTVTSVSASNLQIDTDADPNKSLTGAYEGYAITTGAGESYSDLWVTSSDFNGTDGVPGGVAAVITLAGSEDGVKHLGPIDASTTKYVYFYLNASGAQASSESHNIRVFDGPITGTAINTTAIALTASERGANASNKITVVTHTPSGPGIGGTLEMFISGETGVLQASTPNVVLTPASRTDWPANVFELESVTSTFGATTVDHSLAFSLGGIPNTAYTIHYTFRITGVKTTPTIVQPVNFLQNGNGDLKHTDIDSNGYRDAIASAGTIPEPTMHLTLKRLPASASSSSITGVASTSSIEAVGDTVQHTLRITNTYTENAVVDDFTDVFASSPATPRLVAGSISLRTWNGTTLTTTSLADSKLTISGSTWTFTDFFIVPANSGYIELLYTVSYTSDTGTYTQQATAHIGSAQIDTTTQAADVTPDDAPAIATATVADTDGDAVRNSIDLDSDNDGIADLVESGMAVDPDADADDDGVQNFRDPNSVTCTDTTPADGICDALPVAIDFDGDLIPNHRDLDSDGDGISDAYEAESGDGNGDGRPDGCTSVDASGVCNSGLIASPLNTDGTDGRNFLDTDSDNDGIGDRDEAFDSDGDQLANVTPAGGDLDENGIDDAYDPSCTGSNCGGVTGAPVLALLASYQDQNGDGAPDWLQSCGDAYLTGSEACDDADLDDDDVCSNACLRGNGVSCGSGGQCDSGLCDGGLGTCQPCVAAGGSPDSGCDVATPVCVTSGSSNSCRVCAHTGGAIDDGCMVGAELCDESANGDLGECGDCATAADCSDGNACTTDACSNAACSNTSLAAGSACGAGDVCDGAASNPQCVDCADNPLPGADDFGCSGVNDVCVAGACVDCAGAGDCDDGNACTADACNSNVCSNASLAAGTACGAGDVCDGAATNPQCGDCADNPVVGANDFGCSDPLDVCVAGSCTDCATAADCDDGNDCTTDACNSNVCANTSLAAGSACGAGDVCDGAASNPQCVACADNPVPGADDFGCSGVNDVCVAGTCRDCAGAADCDDGNECTADACNANACANTSLAVGSACGAGDVCDGAASNPQCVNCTDNPIASAPDFGCSGVNDVCVAGACVDCAVDDDCDDGNQCTADACNAGTNTCSHASDAPGTPCGVGDVCNGSGSDPQCVECADNPLPGPDFGCSGTEDVCVAGACEDCAVDADCDDGNECTTDTCDTDTHACSNASEAAGTACGTDDVCDGAASNPQCVNCTDNPVAGADDFGCSGTNDVCDAGVCVDCAGDTDCDDGNACTDDVCDTNTCSNDALPVGTSCGGDDVCNGSGLCVQCTVDADCDDANDCTTDSCSGSTCSNTSLAAGAACGAGDVCDGAASDPQCVACVDNPVLGADDFGCSGTDDVCVDGSCRDCAADADCDDGNECTADACDTNTHLCSNSSLAAGSACGTGEVCDGAASDPQCVACADNPSPGGDDFGCSGTNDVCVAGACADCAVDADCDDANECTADSCDTNTHTCSNTSLAAGSACGTGDVCDGAASNPQCVECTDNPAPGADDFGCTGTNDVCVAGTCEDCAVDADCDDANECTADACDTDTNSCSNTSLAAGTACGTGDVCDGAASNPQCVECTDNPAPGADDFGCTGTNDVCVAGACADCAVDADCDDANECTTDSCDTDTSTCSNTSLAAGTACGTGDVCDGAASNPQCVECTDNPAPGADDFGCTGTDDVCVNGACADCAVDADCDDANECTTDSCDTNTSTCSNTSQPSGTACGSGDVCDGEASDPRCVECVDGDDCDVGEACDADNTCAPGCTDDDDCAGTGDSLVCDTDAGACVQCLDDADCEGIQVCSATNLCGAPDSDGDGLADDVDLDDDNDGATDDGELGGSDLSLDSDGDGLPDYRDADDVTCTDALPLDGECDTLPGAVDLDGDGVPNHFDRDSDGDGLTDAFELAAGDDDGDGVPDDCAPVTIAGECSGGSIASPPDTDATDGADYLDGDSDGDGIGDLDEAFDLDGDETADVPPAGADSDGDGIDDAFDPDCLSPSDCGGVVGTPVTAALTVTQDQNGDDVADWLQVCGDAYVTGSEPCDDGDLDDADACNNACLLGQGEDCGDDDECASTVCADALATCQPCDDRSGGIDLGCSAAAPTCTRILFENACVVCADFDPFVTGIDGGCTGGAPQCDESAAGGLGACVECLNAGDCDDGDECTADACSGGSCTASPEAAGTACTAGVCDGATTPACVECLVDGDCGSGELCSSGNTCIPDGCTGNADCASTPATPVCDLGSGDCVPCTSDAQCAGMTGAPACDFASGECVACTGDSHCPGNTGCATAAHACVFPDFDGDGLPDDVDIDDDGDGIRDAVELEVRGPTRPGLTDPNADDDGDGILDWQDADVVDCDDADDDGQCDAPLDLIDPDRDGLANHVDDDSDGDGVLDAVEGHDANANGWADRKPVGRDTDGDGLDDAFDANCDDDGACGSTRGVMASPTDLDDDGAPNYRDDDDDNDGRSTADERQDAAEYDGPAGNPNDVDGDQHPNWYDVDSDDDGASDDTEYPDDGDYDGDDNGILDALDPLFRRPDSDGDGVPDLEECPPPAYPSHGDCRDSDHDGVDDYLDVDDDNDGILTSDELAGGRGEHDADGDGVPNHLDLDSDGDGIVDLWENGGSELDLDVNGRVDARGDQDGDGLADVFDSDDEHANVFGTPDRVDSDGDGTDDYLDLESDGDGLRDVFEAGGMDENGDGLLDDQIDLNGDGLTDSLDNGLGGDPLPTPDTDGDGERDFQDDDDDGDGIPTRDEAPDEDRNGQPDDARDSDGDGTPDYLEPDADDDGVRDGDELDLGTDPTDADSDGDDLRDGEEVDRYRTDPTDVDTDGDGVSDGREVDVGSDPLHPPAKYKVQGGSYFGCSSSGGDAPGGAWLLFASSAVALGYRRRRAARAPHA